MILGIDLAPEFLSIFFALIITFSLKPKLAVILLGAMLFYILIIFRATQKIGKLFIVDPIFYFCLFFFPD
ncbi:MAG: hypothetical protein COY22_00185 [Candidatus Tagabacteria bacterium CG_4_10_14_0_2_um_filter_40_13]|uniref:Uncharacterized protein n=3 Tax=Candidatus Tagaibacteriota TaxID=1817918 RepID=A0A2M8G8N9_9BACT|nr:MAG: hypothetical protein COV90_02550 [Candidatus Tagabacteria bacterium CG11_big_fil_rev_8_21_14_0_20_41_11]PIU99596.1 MAG: hypothetical protein COS58_01455 [Candidatus Tagabacteria bacterium CG03_land_8_20_14_0_80_41_22]PIZ56755.1 MAG: hypothetical protein COY22_00185 [Candidatus Tagabacteria bacterium CG_4_10_14_0_2_um_filter_40_13]PJC25444.1 MAG: hypothetical protein CO056_00105 [Candidatus Tagabacteria bacterium CG_4_9_14_0_2_um_filter_41_11]PJC69764.1 MAG: hypothetical protein CO014_01